MKKWALVVVLVRRRLRRSLSGKKGGKVDFLFSRKDNWYGQQSEKMAGKFKHENKTRNDEKWRQNEMKPNWIRLVKFLERWN